MRIKKALFLISISTLFFFSPTLSFAGNPWPMFRYNPQHTGRSPYIGVQTASLKWTFTASGQVGGSPAIGADGTVYVGSYDHNIYALNGVTGALKWAFTTGDMVASGAAIGADGTVYVGSRDHKVYALDGATGALKWAFTTGDRVDSSPIIGGDGTVYVGSHDHKVYALDGATGIQKWAFTTGGIVFSSPAIGSDGTIYVGSEDRRVYALDGATGTQKWAFTTGGWVDSSPAIGADGTVYIGSLDQRVYAFDGATGVLKWARTTGGMVSSSPAIGADGTVYVGSLDLKVYAYNGTTGDQKWVFATSGMVGSSPAIGADGTVYVGSFGHKVYALNGATGTQKWVFATDSIVESSPAIGADGTVYVGSGGGKIYAFGVSNTAPIANAGMNQTVHVGNVISLDGSGSSDPEGNYPLTYSWSFESFNPEDSPTLSDPSVISPTFIPHEEGDYVLKLIVTNSLGTHSEPAYVIVSTFNTDPVAEAGDDKVLTIRGSSVQLDGTQSYDLDGDTITYSWNIGSTPEGSNAVIYSSDTATPSFTPDVYGTYTLNLVVTDEWDAVGVDHVTLSFDNIKPVANAGQNQSLVVGETAYLDGIASFDANGDSLSYQWSMVSKPSTSMASLADPYALETSFVPDVPGSYVASLVVSDGIAASDPSNITIQVISQQTALTDTVLETVEIINTIPLDHFQNANMANALTNKLNAVLQMIEQGMYAEALDQLQNDVLKKTDGCALNGSPDKNDWIKDCNDQVGTYQIIMDAITRLQSMI